MARGRRRCVGWWNLVLAPVLLFVVYHLGRTELELADGSKAGAPPSTWRSSQASASADAQPIAGAFAPDGAHSVAGAATPAGAQPIDNASAPAGARPFAGAGSPAGQQVVWHFCAAQWHDCACPGTMRWGSGQTWLEMKPGVGEQVLRIECSVDKLEDILPGDDSKHCECTEKPEREAGDGPAIGSALSQSGNVDSVPRSAEKREVRDEFAIDNVADQSDKAETIPRPASESQREPDAATSDLERGAKAKATAKQAAEWYFCASQGQTCICPGTMRWGTNRKWLEVAPSPGQSEVRIECSIQKLEDILPGDAAKHCECSVKPSNVLKPGDTGQAEAKSSVQFAPEPAITGDEFWLLCATQWQECHCEGTIRWGVDGQWLYIAPQEGKKDIVQKCGIDKLPDNAPGNDGKRCDCLVKSSAEAFTRINPGLLLTAGRLTSGVDVANSVGSCEAYETGSLTGAAGAQLWEAVRPMCSPAWVTEQGGSEEFKAGRQALGQDTLRTMMRVWVDPRFMANYKRHYDSSGWAPRAFVNYYAGAPKGKHAYMTEELIKSVHMFSKEPIVVVHFGFATVARWKPEDFPRLVLLNAAPLPPSSGRSFNFNKLRAMLLSRVLVGIQLDSDQWVAPGVDRMFRRTEEEVTQHYPFPILPAHFLDWGPSGQGPGGNGAELWKRYCPAGKEGKCRWQTQRWGHAHPTWTFWALPFLGRWLRRNFRDERLPAGEGKKALRVIDVKEDEDLLNVGTWEDGGTKQWCKFDMVDPTEFDAILWARPSSSLRGGRTACTRGLCGDIEADKKYHPEGVPKAFYTAHHAVDPSATKKYLQRVKESWDNNAGGGSPLAQPILYHREFYKDGEELRAAYPDLKCLI